MNILLVEAGGMNISPDFDAKAQLTACHSTHKHAMRLFPPVWTQKYIQNRIFNFHTFSCFIFIFVCKASISSSFINCSTSFNLAIRFFCCSCNNIIFSVLLSDFIFNFNSLNSEFIVFFSFINCFFFPLNFF